MSLQFMKHRRVQRCMSTTCPTVSGQNGRATTWAEVINSNPSSVRGSNSVSQWVFRIVILLAVLFNGSMTQKSHASEAMQSADDNQYVTTILKGSIDSNPIIMTLYDMEDALDERGTMWKYTGKLTYTESGVELKLDGYIKRLYLFLEAYDAKGTKAGHLELESIDENDIPGYKGTLRDPDGKEHSVKVMESE